MRRMWAAGAVFVSCLVVNVGPAAGHWAKDADMDALEGTGTLNLEVVDLVGREGLTLEAGVLWGFDWPGPVIDTVVDASPFSASGQRSMEGLGTQIVLVTVSVPGSESPEHGCSVEFDLREGEDVWLRVGLPPDPATGKGWDLTSEPCLVDWLLHHDPSIEQPHE